MAPILFEEGQYDRNQQISISELKVKFESLGVQSKKSLQVARYLVEPVNEEDFIVNESASLKSQEVL